MYATETPEQYAVQAKLVQGNVKPCSPPSPAVALIDQLRLAQNETHSLIGDLETRLAFVLRIPTETDNAARTSNPHESQILTELSTRIEMEVSAQDRLRKLLNELVV